MAPGSLRWLFLPPSPPPAPFSFAPDEPVRPLLSLGLLSERKAENTHTKKVNACNHDSSQTRKAETFTHNSDLNGNFVKVPEQLGV